MARRYWLVKSEPDVFSIDDLAREKATRWEGVRNYQARNFMLHDMKVGDLVLFYHSNAEPSGIAGLATVSKPASPDPSALDKNSPFFDEKSSPENPRWQCIEVKFKSKFSHLLPLQELRERKTLKDMVLLKRGSRLSVQPVSPKEFTDIMHLAGEELP